MAHSSLRPRVLGSYQAEVGLILADLSDLKHEKELSLAEIPLVVHFPASLSKTPVAYTTFRSSQHAPTLLAHIRGRRKSSKILTGKSPEISVRSTRRIAERRRAKALHAKGFVVPKAVIKEIHDVQKEATQDWARWRPFVLRAYA